MKRYELPDQQPRVSLTIVLLFAAVPCVVGLMGLGAVKLLEMIFH